MHRCLAGALVVLLSVPASVGGQPPKKQLKPPCAANIDDCARTGCGTAGQFDPDLNQRKNILESENTNDVTGRTIQWIKKLDDPENFSEGETREELTGLGEGDMVSIVAYVLVVRPELSGESCNCYLHTPEGTDNHLVVVSRTTVDTFPTKASMTKTQLKAILAQREAESITAEFTPRVRQESHPHFTMAFLQPMVDKAPRHALLARITGQLMFDSEHFIRNHLKRITNWEIHPVTQLEVCPNGGCKTSSDAGWKSIDDLTNRITH